jgi:hypothetical protein
MKGETPFALINLNHLNFGFDLAFVIFHLSLMPPCTKGKQVELRKAGLQPHFSP